MLDKLIDKLKAYAGSKRKAVVGVHGDLYSTTAVALCLKALGAMRTECVLAAMRVADEEERVRNALQGTGAFIRIADTGQIVTELAYRCYYPDVESSMEAVRKRVPLAEYDVLRYLADCIGGFVVNPVTLDHRMLGEITEADRLADLAPFWNMHAREVRELAEELGLPRHVQERLVDPDRVERIGCDLADAECMWAKFINDEYRDTGRNQVLMYTGKWPVHVMYCKNWNWYPKKLSGKEEAVARAHNKGLPQIRKLMLDDLSDDVADWR